MSVHIDTKIEHFQPGNIRKELEVLTDKPLGLGIEAWSIWFILRYQNMQEMQTAKHHLIALSKKLNKTRTN